MRDQVSLKCALNHELSTFAIPEKTVSSLQEVQLENTQDPGAWCISVQQEYTQPVSYSPLNPVINAIPGKALA